jgi:protein-tyrosine phosphatase
MQQIMPYSLWIGTAGDLRHLCRLHDVGIRAVVQLAYEENPIALPREFIVCRFPLLDGADNDGDLLRLAIASLAQLLEQKFPTLVCCQAGLSRSPAIASAALARLTGAPLVECVRQIAAVRPCSIHPALLAQLRTPGDF